MAGFDFLTMEDAYQEKPPGKFAVQDIKEAWFTGEDADTIDFKVQKAIMRFVGNESYDQIQIIESVIAEIGVDRPTAIKGLSWLTDSKRLVTSHGPRGSILYQKPTGEQFGDDMVDDWIFRNVRCVLLYKDGIMDIYPVEEYTNYELTMLQKDANYKSAWIPIRYGSFMEMQKCMYEIAREGLRVIDTARSHARW